MNLFIFNSSIGKKLIMSLSGVFLILFLLFHSCMNFVVLFSPEVYNAICAFLGANWYAIIGTGILALGFVVHMLYALVLTFQNMRARGEKNYVVSSKQKDVEWAAQNMFVLGFIIVGFLTLHLYNFWYKMQFAELTGIRTGIFDPENGAAYVRDLFTSSWAYCVLYIVWFSAIWFHLTHGVWSALQSIGLNNETWLPRVKLISNIISTIIVLMFTSIPVYYLIIG